MTPKTTAHPEAGNSASEGFCSCSVNDTQSFIWVHGKCLKAAEGREWDQPRDGNNFLNSLQHCCHFQPSVSWEVSDNPGSSLGNGTSWKQRSQRVHSLLYSRKGSGWGKGMKGWNTRLVPSWLQDKRFALKKSLVISYFLKEKWCPRCGVSSSQGQGSVSPIIFIMGLDCNFNPTGLGIFPAAWPGCWEQLSAVAGWTLQEKQQRWVSHSSREWLVPKLCPWGLSRAEVLSPSDICSSVAFCPPSFGVSYCLVSLYRLRGEWDSPLCSWLSDPPLWHLKHAKSICLCCV